MNLNDVKFKKNGDMYLFIITLLLRGSICGYQNIFCKKSGKRIVYLCKAQSNFLNNFKLY